MHAVCWHNTVTFPSDLFGRTKVRTLSGLYLCRPLDLYRPFVVPETLIQFETEMKQREVHFLRTKQLAMAAIS